MKLQQSLSIFFLAVGLSLSSSSSYASLLGVTPELPTISFSGSGMIGYDAGAGNVTVSGDPSTFFSIAPFINSDIQDVGQSNPKQVSISFQVDNSGTLIGGSTTPNLVLTGAVDTDGDFVADTSGTLLTADVTQFGFQNGANDQFDLRLNNIGGLLAGFYSGMDLAVSIVSFDSAEYPNPFDGSFDSDWQGAATGSIGAVNPVPVPAVAWLWAGAVFLVARKKHAKTN